MNSFLLLKLLAFVNLQALPKDALKRKHFCPTCANTTDALEYSQKVRIKEISNIVKFL